MKSLLPLLAVCGALTAAAADAQPPVIQKLDAEIDKAKEKRAVLKGYLKAARESHLKYQLWLKDQFRQAKFEDAAQTARVLQAVEIQRQLSLAGIQPTGGVAINRFGRVVGFSAGVYVDPAERAAGLLLGERLTNKAFDEYAAWRQTIGNDLNAARQKLFEYGRVKAQLDRDVTKLGRWIDAAERTKKTLKESGKLPPAGYSSRLPAGVLLAMTFDKPTTRGDSVMVIQDLSGWGNHGLATRCKLVKGVVGDALGLSGDSRQFRTLLDQKEVQAVAFWLNVDSFRKSQYLIQGKTRAFTAQFVGAQDLRFVMGGTDGKPRTITVRHGLKAGKWHHLAFILDRRQRRFLVFIDGRRMVATTMRTGIPDHDAYLNVSGEKPSLRGKIDELVAFRQPLTAAEVKTVFEMGKNGQSLAATKRKSK